VVKIEAVVIDKTLHMQAAEVAKLPDIHLAGVLRDGVIQHRFKEVDVGISNRLHGLGNTNARINNTYD
jgi:hypothetical protein